MTNIIHFSVSPEYTHIIDKLKEQPNRSKFICQAIDAYLQKQKPPITKEDLQSLTPIEMEQLFNNIKQVLSELHKLT